MNVTRFLSLLSMLLSLFFVTYTDQDTEKREQKQLRAAYFPQYFFTPLSCSEKSITFFLKKIYNDRKYPQFFLANNFMHVIDGLNFAHTSPQPRFTLVKILSLFEPKLISIYTNPYAFSHLLDELLPAVAPYCNKQQERLNLIESIKECIGVHIIDNYQAFKDNPDDVLNKLSSALSTLFAEPEEEKEEEEDRDISIRELQHAISHFLSHGLSRLVWNPVDQVDTWHNVKLLAYQLEKLSEQQSIDTKMLNTLLWALVNRYSYFISLVAKELKPPFFEAVRADLQSDKAVLWCAEEDPYITTKLEHLTLTLLEAEVAAQIDTQARPQ